MISKTVFWPFVFFVAIIGFFYPQSVAMQIDHDVLMEDDELKPLFTAQNTQIAIITQESVAQIIATNKYSPEFNLSQSTSLREIIKHLGLKSSKKLSQQDVAQILSGINQLMQLDCADQFSMYRLDLNDAASCQRSLSTVGKITGEYFAQASRPYGFNIIALLKDKTELWFCEIPSQEEVQAVIEQAKKSAVDEENPDATPFKGKEAEVMAAMEMFQPLLKILFIDGQPEDVQARRKACWSCCKGTVALFVILVVGAYMIIGATAGLIVAINQK